MDINYDGYYDDVKPVDAWGNRRREWILKWSRRSPFSWLAFLL